MIKAVFFDLDGTIVDSEEGITKCVQYALKKFGIDEPNLKALRCFIGPPLDETFAERYGFDKEKAADAVKKYRERYNVTGIFECRLYDGIRELIGGLKKDGYVTAVASSKPETMCRRILEHFSLENEFDWIVGATLDGRISTKQEVLEELGRRMESAGISKEEMCLIGDTAYDAVGAARFGIRCIGVSYGFGTREKLLEAGACRVCDSAKEAGDAVREL